MDLQARLTEAAVCLRSGNHVGAERVIAELQREKDIKVLECALAMLETAAREQQDAYVHFVALKLLRFGLIRHRAEWVMNRADLQAFLMRYMYGLAVDGTVLAAAWRPVVAEWSSTVAVALKLGCVHDGATVQPAAVREAVEQLLLWLREPAASHDGGVALTAQVYLHRTLCQSVLEEFGVYSVATRCRGLPIRLHRQCRSAVEQGGLLPRVFDALLQSLLPRSVAVPETSTSVEAGLSALGACLAWPNHRFFEEDRVTDELCDVFEVDDALWDALLLTASQPSASQTTAAVPTASVFEVLCGWCVQGQIHGAVIHTQEVVEMVSQLCAFKGSRWGQGELCRFLPSAFVSCLQLFAHFLQQQQQQLQASSPSAVSQGNVSQDDSTRSVQQQPPCGLEALPTLAGGVHRLVSNSTECCVHEPSLQPFLTQLGDLTRYMLTLCDVQVEGGGEEESVMACLDELLSMWYGIAVYVGRAVHDGAAAALRESCAAIFTAYVECKTRRATAAVRASQASSSMTEANPSFDEAFTESHLNLIAHIGRAASVPACATLIRGLCDVGEQLVQGARRSTSAGGATAAGSDGHDGSSGGLACEAELEACYEPLWVLLKLTAAFVADPSDGEQTSIPRCFTDAGSQAEGQLVQLMTIVLHFGSVLGEAPVTSPAVFAAYVDILTNYIRTYVESDEAGRLYTQALQGGAEVVAVALRVAAVALKRCAYEADAMGAVGTLLDTIADKSAAVRAYAAAQPSVETITKYAYDMRHFHFVGHTRGRLMAFLLQCVTSGAGPPTDATLAPRLALFAAVQAELDEVQETLSALAGLLESLRLQELIRAAFPLLVRSADRLRSVCASMFYEREIAIELLQAVLAMFTTCAPVLENADLVTLLELVAGTLRFARDSLAAASAWHSHDEAAEDDRARFVAAIARLLAAAAQWQALDCFLPDDDTAALAGAAVDTLAHLLRHLDERLLRLPVLVEAVFSAFHLCAESFTARLVFYPDSQSFLTALLYALDADAVAVQRVGIAVTTRIALCLEQSADDAANHQGVCRDLLRVVLRALVTGRVAFVNTHATAKTVITVARGVGQGALGELFQGLLDEMPEVQGFLEGLYAAICEALTPTAPPAEAGRVFELALQDLTATLRGICVV